MKNNIESYITSFGEYLTYELNYHESTLKTYQQALKTYLKFLTLRKLNFLVVSKEDAQSYKAYLVSNNYNNKTSSLCLSTVRSFYDYLVEINKIKANPFSNLKNPKIVKKLPNFLNSSETMELFNNYHFENDLELRNIFILEFLYVTGLRVSELCSLKIDDMDFQNYTFKILGKGSKERLVFFKAINSQLLSQYLEARKRILQNKESPYLIVSNTGCLKKRSVELIVKKYALKHNIQNKVTPHTLRHTYATDLLNNGADIRVVGELLGHSSLSTTQIYTHVTSERLKSVYKNTHPRSK